MPSLERPAITNTVIDVSPYDLGKAIGGWNSEEQALVLQGLSDQLHAHGTVAAHAQVEYIIQQLEGRADYLLELLAEYAHDRAADKFLRTQADLDELAEAWDKARGITPAEPIMDEDPAEETDR